MSKKIQILMATYNAENYLQEQLDSILGQSYRDWELLIRDDGSTDATQAIIDEYAQKNSRRIRVIKDDLGNLRASGNFSELLRVSDAAYIMFSDQDDVWKPEKIEKSFKKIRDIEQQHAGIPIMVHSDLRVVDQGLNEIAPSFWKYQKLDPSISYRYKDLAVQNVVTGCTMIMNQAARDCVLPIPEKAVMHDWWIAVMVAYYGKVEFIDETLIDYRQHGRNEIGASKVNISYFLRKLSKLGNAFRRIFDVRKMAKHFPFRYGLGKILWHKTICSIRRLLQ